MNRIVPCANFFGGKEQGLKDLHSLKYQIDPKLETQGKIVGDVVTVSPTSGFLQPNDSSRNLLIVDDSGTLAVISLTGVQARSFAQFHETAHKGARFGNTDVDDIDTATHSMNQLINNRKIWKACFSEVKSQPYKGDPPLPSVLRPQ